MLAVLACRDYYEPPQQSAAALDGHGLAMRLYILAVGTLTLACSRSAGRSGPAFVDDARTVGATLLLDSTAFPSALREGRDSVESELRQHGEDPALYAARTSADGDSMVKFQLWHEGAFAPTVQGQDGNPGGHGITLNFDRRRHRITGRWRWE